MNRLLSVTGVLEAVDDDGFREDEDELEPPQAAR
jgi:hypothetical protein